jgi:hypothetical protein
MPESRAVLALVLIVLTFPLFLECRTDEISDRARFLAVTRRLRVLHDHHDLDAPILTLTIHGATATPELQSALAEFGALAITETSEGFVASRDRKS